jgi:hypothetical protein
MKRIYLILAGILLISIYSFGQSGNNYRDRNHKLNKNYVEDLKKSSSTIPMKNDISQDVYNYLSRNNKLNQGTSGTLLELVRPVKDFHYRAMNHKLNPDFKHGAPLTDETAVTHR